MYFVPFTDSFNACNEFMFQLGSNATSIWKLIYLGWKLKWIKEPTIPKSLINTTTDNNILI